MDPRLVQHYKRELTHLREIGGEFAREFPKIAARLSLDGTEVSDPYVERLLEGFALMAARVQLRMDAEYPRFIQHLLEVVYPGFLSAVPAMMIARFEPDLAHPALARGHLMARGSALLSDALRGSATACEFRTAHDVTLWPIEITSARYVSVLTDLPAVTIPGAGRARGALRISLRAHGGLGFAQLPIDQLTFHVCAGSDIGFRLYELLADAGQGCGVVWREAGVPKARWVGASCLQRDGFEPGQAMLPVAGRDFDGHRLIQEYAALPERFRFITVTGLRNRLAAVAGDEVELVIPLSRGDAGLESLVDGASLALFCTPAINLFPKRLDRIAVTAGRWEHQVIADRTRPLDYEVHELTSVTGYGPGNVGQQEFFPMYASFHTEASAHRAYYSVRREQRMLSAGARSDGPRSSYIGQEVYVSLVDRLNAPYADDLRQLSVQALVSNRDLPLLLPALADGQTGGWSIDGVAPIRRISCLRGPSRPRARLPQGDAGWGLVSQLGINYLGLAAADPAQAAASLRTMLRLYGSPDDPSFERQVDALTAVSVEQVVRRLPFDGPLTFGTGLSVTVTVDEPAFEGGSVYLLGALLERWIARHAAVNAFTTLTLRSAGRGEPLRWPPRIGARPLL